MFTKVLLLGICLGKDYKIEKNELQFDKEICELSKNLKEKNIEHIIVKDNNLGVGIILKADAPSVLTYDKINKEWDYFSQYIEKEDDEPKLYAQYIIPNKLDIIKFIDIIVKTCK